MLDPPSLRLPAGMRDFAPRAAAARRRIAETLLSVFERWGYARVITPAFEYEEVLALGLGDGGRAAALKFVEPSSGRVVALRPDITPQIARLIATRFREEVGPVRLSYEGTVLRLDRDARAQRELIQAGVELAGVSAPHGDCEVLSLAVAALAAAGLSQPTLALGHLGLTRAVFASLELAPPRQVEVRTAIAKRDAGALRDLLREGGVSSPARRFAESLADLSGDVRVLDQAARLAPSPPIGRAIAELKSVVDLLVAQEVPARLHVDLAEVRGFDYYTGVRFQAFVPGAAAPVVQGGRYDDLLGRYGRPSPAVGFAVDVEAAAGALEAPDGGPHASLEPGGDRPALIVGDRQAAFRQAQALRAEGRRAVPLLADLADDDVDAYAARWGYGEVISAAPAARARHAPRAADRAQRPRRTAASRAAAAAPIKTPMKTSTFRRKQ